MTGPFAWFKWEALFKDWAIFKDGFLTTLTVSILGLALALILGIFFGVLSVSKIKIFKFISRVYVEFIQNTPLVIQAIFLYNGLPLIANIVLPVKTIGVLAVGIYHGAYIAEVVRAGIMSINKGQLEAALSQGFNYWEAMRYIILPQARIVMLPPLTNQAVNLVKNTSVLAMIAGGDLMYRTDSWANEKLYYGPAYVLTGLLYLIICLPLATLAKRLEKVNFNNINRTEDEEMNIGCDKEATA
ncbi:amino acid ABC transporter permease [Defluviitalea phaphyphila]|uniref:amino acid ABC transporter permease n=1 Tax=Defluviitalea phaphyphila TaxID=1473580 RepID=UPI0007317CE1|nr:amino acid ABC transporter permease [Defluviitalea phaphyphila]